MLRRGAISSSICYRKTK